MVFNVGEFLPRKEPGKSRNLVSFERHMSHSQTLLQRACCRCVSCRFLSKRIDVFVTVYVNSLVKSVKLKQVLSD